MSGMRKEHQGRYPKRQIKQGAGFFTNEKPGAAVIGLAAHHPQASHQFSANLKFGTVVKVIARSDLTI